MDIKNGTNGKVINSQAGMDKAVKKICDILRRDKAKGARLYVAELTWIFFLRYLDLIDEKAAAEAKALKVDFEPTLKAPYRWRDWAAAYDRRKDPEAIIKNKDRGWKRCEIDNHGWLNPVKKGETGTYIDFINKELFPYLKGLKDFPSATNKQKIVSLVFVNKDQTVVRSVANMQDVLDGVENLTNTEISDRHIFPISQAFEGLLPSLGEKKNDGGQFFTPREVIRLIVEVLKPQVGKTVYDPCCGTGGFLIEAYKYMGKQNPTATQLKALKTEALWGREDADEAIPVVLANMALHDIDLPRIWHGNTLNDTVTSGDLFLGAPPQFDYVMTNPPFGSKEGNSAQAKFAYKTGKAQVLFLQHIIDSLKDGGTCGMVIDEGVLFHTKTAAYTQTKRKLLNDCNLFCIVSLPGGVFVNAGAGVKTDLFFFTKGKRTEKIWYYDMTLADDFRPRKVNKGNPLHLEHFADFLRRLALPEDHPERISERSWYKTKAEIEATNYDLKAVNNNAPDFTDKRTPEELLAVIRQSQQKIMKSLEAFSMKKKIPAKQAV
jgi:type I restriction enzyme M protein